MSARLPLPVDAPAAPKTTPQLFTHFADTQRRTLVTELVERPLRALGAGEILVEMLYVPMHGSFWLATHPDLLHPRKDAFLKDGGFVFGNGGVGRVIASSGQAAAAAAGDFVVVYGHVPCGREECVACRVQHRYTECAFGESTIIGHGGGAPDGTYSRHVVLPPYSYELCFSAADRPDERALRPLMYAFLLADVRNALTRDPETSAHSRMLLFGAGQSGRAAAYLHLRDNANAKVVVVEASAERAKLLQSLNPDAIAVYVPPADVVTRLNGGGHGPPTPEAIGRTIDGIVATMHRHFGHRLCDLVFDASSGNTAPLWANARVLSPGCHCIAFGFGSGGVQLDREVLQISGLSIRTSRGVGTLENRLEVIRLIKAGAGNVVDDYLIADAVRLNGFEAAAEFVRAQQAPPKMLHEIPQAYVAAGHLIP